MMTLFIKPRESVYAVKHKNMNVYGFVASIYSLNIGV